MTEQLINELSQHPDYQVLRRLPMTLSSKSSTQSSSFIATIIDLETMGLDARCDEIIEMGLLSFSFNPVEGILSIVDSYNELNNPGRPIPNEVTKITGITDEDVKDKAIDWQHVYQLLDASSLILCHNSKFDRNFLELQTPDNIQNIIKPMPFACTINDIDWHERGYESSKLDYLNWKLGYFYDGHRALVDCWATLNLFLHEEGAFFELLENVRKKETLICAVNAPFERKDNLKLRGYRWSDGSGSLPKCWWKSFSNDKLIEEKNWLDEVIYGRKGASEAVPKAEITARKRYSFRAEEIS
jgi:DNA polymerase III subunit epsilon